MGERRVSGTVASAVSAGKRGRSFRFCATF
jgi:hypothetical protein